MNDRKCQTRSCDSSSFVIVEAYDDDDDDALRGDTRRQRTPVEQKW